MKGVFIMAVAACTVLALSGTSDACQERVTAKITELEVKIGSRTEGTVTVKALVGVTPQNMTAQHEFKFVFTDKAGATVKETTKNEVSSTTDGKFFFNFPQKAGEAIEGVKCTYKITSTAPTGASDTKEAIEGTRPALGPPTLPLPTANETTVTIKELKVKLPGEKKTEGNFTAQATGGTKPYLGSALVEITFFDKDKKALAPQQFIMFHATSANGFFTGQWNLPVPEGTEGVKAKVTIVATDSAGKQGGDSKTAAEGTVP